MNKDTYTTPAYSVRASEVVSVRSVQVCPLRYNLRTGLEYSVCSVGVDGRLVRVMYGMDVSLGQDL